VSPEAFCRWLWGALELNPDAKTFNEAQTAMIRKHLGLVFENVTAEQGDYLALIRGQPENPQTYCGTEEATLQVPLVPHPQRGGINFDIWGGRRIC
jgi:hypothetical protein